MAVYFKRKAYDRLLDWKRNDANHYSILLEGARRVGKSTIAKRFAEQEYRSYILIDFANTTQEVKDCFRDIGNLDLFFLRLQAVTNTTLYVHESGRISAMYHAIPSQLAKDAKRYRLARAIGKNRTTASDEKLLYELIDSKTVNIAYNTTDPWVSLSNTKDLDSYKMYVADTGLFLTLMFIDRPEIENEIYARFLSDHLPANLGYVYENVAAQMITASGRELYYHTWKKKDSTHYYEIDFLISSGIKVSAIEIKSSDRGKHESLTEFQRSHSKNIAGNYVFSQKDRLEKDGIHFLPIYAALHSLMSLYPGNHVLNILIGKRLSFPVPEKAPAGILLPTGASRHLLSQCPQQDSESHPQALCPNHPSSQAHLP